MRWTFWVAGSNRYEVVVGPIGAARVGALVAAVVEAEGLPLSLDAGVAESGALAPTAGKLGPAESSLTRIWVPNQPEKRSAWAVVTA